MSVKCPVCMRDVPQEPGQLIADERHVTCAHVNARGKDCPMGSTQITAISRRVLESAEHWIDALDLGPELAIVSGSEHDGPHQAIPGHENCRWTGGRWYPCDTRAPDWADERD